MDKNTIWAIVLSTLVIIGAYLLMPLITGNKNAEVQDTSNEVVIENGDESSANSGSTNENAASSTESIFSENESLILAAEDDEVPLTEEKVTINTGCAEIICTTFLYQTFYNFRNLKNDTIDLSSREVYFVGENGQGKSNILESLYYSAYGNSFRTYTDSQIVKNGEKNFSINYCFCSNNFYEKHDSE